MKLSEVIVGNCIESLLKSYTENKKIILTSFNAPHFVDDFEQPIIIEDQQYTNISDAWNFLRFIVSLRGLVVNPKDVFSVRIESNFVSFSAQKVEFEKCHLFPSSKVKCDLDIRQVKNEDLFKVLDIMKLPFCNVENVTTQKIDNSFIDHVKFYGKKKIVCVSYLTKKQLNDFDYSDTMSRIYVEKHLLECEDIIRPLISPSRGMRKPKPVVLERVVLSMREDIYTSTDEILYYEHKDRDNIIKTYCRNNSSR